MHDAVTMGVAQRIRELGKDAVNIVQGKWTLRLHPVFERACIKISHDEIGNTVALPIIKHRQNMRMLEFGNDARLLMKARREFLAFRQLTWQDFDSDVTIYRRLIGFVHGCHAPFADLTNNAIRAEHLSGLKSVHARSGRIDEMI